MAKTNNVCFRIFSIIVKFSDIMFVTSDQPYHLNDQVPLERGSSIGKKKSAKKGASGTRGDRHS